MSGQNITSDVTAAVTTQSGTPKSDAFLKRVLPWPGSDGAGWVNLHWTKIAPDGRARWRGSPFKTADELLELAQRLAMNEDKASDIFFCLSVQSQCRTNTMADGRSFRVAERDTKLATLLKAIWLDIDIKDPPKGYSTIAEAKRALLDFCSATNLPLPSARVESGGGMHCYWISDKPLTVEEWRPYAEGLKELALKHGLRCDAGVTTDVVRILRMPGTFNRKIKGQPRPCTLKSLAGRDYNFETELAGLKAIGSSKVTAPVTTPEPFDLSGFNPPCAMIMEACKSEMEAGLGTFTNIREDRLLDPTLTIKECPAYKHSFLTGGRHDGQGLWNLLVLGATFCENGRVFAHELSKEYPAYKQNGPDETDAMYDRKLMERQQKGLGWPSCKAFENEGCKLCATCAHKGKIKSPLHLAWPSKAPTSIGQAQQQAMLPVEALLTLAQSGANIEQLLTAMNENFAVVRYRSEILVANIMDKDIIFMTEQDFHKMFANLNFFDPKTVASNLQEMKQRIGTVGSAITSMSSEDLDRMFADLILVIKNPVKVSKRWFNWSGRRRYFGRGVAFEPGGPLEIKHDTLNLWRGFAIEPKQGDWSRLRNHIKNVVCSGNKEHFNYLIRWMAYAVQRPSEPIGVAVAFRGAPGAGKGIVGRTLGDLFGRHYAHIANGDQLVGRFNASLGTSCFVFLDEALWAGDKKGEGVLKALITEPRLQLEAKFRDPIMVDNRLRIMVASNEDWVVPTGLGDRRWFILDAADTFAGTKHPDYWDPIYAEIANGGKAAMFYDLMNMDLKGFNVRAVPHTAAKAQQQAHSLHGTEAWLFHVLEEGKLGAEVWQKTGLQISTDLAYSCYEDFSKRQRHYRPDTKSVWSKKLRIALGDFLADARTGQARDRSFRFAPLADCRRQYEIHAGAPNIQWEPEYRTEDAAEKDPATEAPGFDGDFPREPDEGKGHPMTHPARAPETSDLFSRAAARAAADHARVRNMR